MSENAEKPSEVCYVESPVKPHLESDPGAAEILGTDAMTEMPAKLVPEVCKELNLVDLDKNVVQELAKLGAAVESNGSVQVGNGAVMVTELALMRCALHIRDTIKDGPSAFNAQKALCEIAKAVTGIGHFWKTRISTNAKSAPGPNRVESFDADTPVRPMNLQINIHGEKNGKPAG